LIELENLTYSIITVKPFSEELLALFTSLPFDSFEEKDDSFDGYIDQSLLNETLLDEIRQITERYNAEYTISELEHQNWNEIWESNFSPVEVDDFVRIRADFHEEKEGFAYDLVIQPKMAFGTGHHQTTYMMIQAMKSLNFKDTEVLDYGCGTGILSIVAEKLGAKEVVSVDIEYPSYENTIENAAKNNCIKISSIHGILSDVPQKQYDVILANINRNVLLESASNLISLLRENGILLLSGILLDDYDAIMHKFNVELSLTPVMELKRDQWMCLQFKK
jgi:ribosomal protein L11 methyltransferase